MKANICIFEDSYVRRLAPLNYLRHTSDLICGAFSLRNKISVTNPDFTISLHSRKYIEQLLRENNPQIKINSLVNKKYIFLNSRIILPENNFRKLVKYFSDNPYSCVIADDTGTIIAFHTDLNKSHYLRDVINNYHSEFVSLEDVEASGLRKYLASKIKLGYTEINTPSDLVYNNEKELHSDLDILIKGRKKILIRSKNKISRKVEFDTTGGKIYIGKNTVIEPFVFIKGPVYIGDNCLIRSGTCIYGPVSVGNTSKISGEISSSIIHPFVNKQHYGFLGHSYICEWVNLGAGTTTSNLKNNYSPITLKIDGTNIQTGSVFLGSIIGDHTKTGIGTMLNTGTVIGISSNLYGAGYHNKIINSFTWNDAGSNKSVDYIPDKAIATARITMSRRNIQLSPAYEEVLMKLYNDRHNLPV